LRYEVPFHPHEELTMRNIDTPVHSKDKDAEHQAPGGATVNRVANVATSAVLGGATAGAIAGAMAGPVGAAVGAAVGAVAAGFAGNSISEAIDVEAEEAYWRDNYNQRPYVEPGQDFNDYGPAYGYGVDVYALHQGRSFDEAEADLSRGWDSSRGASSLGWDRARHATRDAWERLSNTVERAVPGDADRDGR